MGDERAETYLRLRAEAEFRRLRAEAEFRRVPATAITDGGDRVRLAGWTLVAAGLLTRDFVERVVAELEAALVARSRTEPDRRARRLGWALDQLAAAPPDPAPPQGDPADPAADPIRITPIGQTIRVSTERAPSELHLMTLACRRDGAVITAAMRMRWPPDGSSTDLEITGAGPQHLPYDQLWAIDDRGAVYRVTLSGEGGTATWQGSLDIYPAPPPGSRWLDLIADGKHRLVRLDLQAARAGPPARVTRERLPPEPAGERLLTRAGERILASVWDAAGPDADPGLGEMITVLLAAGAIAADSPAPGQLAELCRRLGVTGAGITAPPAADLPGQWASVLAQRGAGPAGPQPELFAPLGVVLPRVDGTQFALVGLSSAAGQSNLHVLAPDGVRQADSNVSWWVRDDAGAWHVAAEPELHAYPPGRQLFRLRLAPPLPTRPERIEVVVTGATRRVRALVPVRDGHTIADT